MLSCLYCATECLTCMEERATPPMPPILLRQGSAHQHIWFRCLVPCCIAQDSLLRPADTSLCCCSTCRAAGLCLAWGSWRQHNFAQLFGLSVQLSHGGDDPQGCSRGGQCRPGRGGHDEGCGCMLDCLSDVCHTVLLPMAWALGSSSMSSNNLTHVSLGMCGTLPVRTIVLGICWCISIRISCILTCS